MQVGDSTEIFGCLECHRIEEESRELLEKPYGPLDELEKLWPEDEVDGNLFPAWPPALLLPPSPTDP